jgi:hypothetical protein
VADRLRDQARIGAIAAHQRRQRAVAGAFLLGDGLQVDAALRRVTCGPDRIERVNHRRHASLHILRAAAVHPAVAHHTVKRRKIPEVNRAFRHHVDMALHDQAASFPVAIISRHDLSRAGKIDPIHRGRLRMAHQIDIREAEGIDLVAALGQAFGHPGLKRGLLTAETAKLYQPGEEGHLVVKVAINSSPQFFRKTVVLGQISFQGRLLFAG